MRGNAVHSDAFTLALDKTTGTEFEGFAKAYFSILEGGTFVPTGGVHDGGADGLTSSIFEDGKPDTFYQFTVQEDHRAKIRSTVKRLREFGRNPKRLIYVTSRHTAAPDKDEDELDTELGLRIRIRAREYLIGHINDSPQTQSAFAEHLSHKLAFLKMVGAATLISKTQNVTDPSVYVFLQQEARHRTSKSGLIHELTDSLIVWALSGTDPDRNIFLDTEQIRRKILDVVPWAKQFLNAELTQRLIALQKKLTEHGRLIQFHKKANAYCLPVATREVIEAENLEDETLVLSVRQELVAFANKYAGNGLLSATTLTEIALQTLQAFFEKQGLLLSYYIKHDDPNLSNLVNVMSDRIDEVLEVRNLTQDQILFARENVHRLLTHSFYGNSQHLGEYLSRLSQTYVMMFSLQAEPRLTEYFQQMSADFRLLIGSDILIRAISERYLEEPEQSVRTLLSMCAKSGSKLVLTAPVLREVFHHLWTTNFEFINHYAPIEPFLTRPLISNCDRILIRAFFYAKSGGKASGWKSYLGQFVEWNDLMEKRGIDQLRTYLMAHFNLEFLDDESLGDCTPAQKVESLTAALMKQNLDGSADKKKEELAKNDALMVHAVYGLRRQNKETSRVTEFGYSTWWLTQEIRILRHTADLVKEHSSPYVMRPEFLLNFLSLSPKTVDVRKGFQKIFPSAIGLQMGHRLPTFIFNEILDGVHNWSELEPASVTAKVNMLSNKLKADQLKRYEVNLKSVKELLR